MAQQLLKEHAWKPVNLQQSLPSSGMGFSHSNNSMSWFRKVMTLPQDYHQKIMQYNAMDNESIEISRALDIIAEDVSSQNADDEELFNIIYPEDTKNFRKRDITTLELAKNNFIKRIGFDENFYEHIRHTLKYGCKIFFVKDDFTLIPLMNERFNGVVYTKDIDQTISHYIYNFGDQDVSRYLSDSYKQGGGGSQSNIYAIPADKLFILKNGEGPFGESVLDRVFKTWRRVQLLEDAVVIYRVIRAPERRIFYIDVGDLPPKKAESVVEQAKMKLRQRQISRKGQVQNEFDPFSATEDYFIPQSGQGRGSKIETLQGGSQGQDNLEDTKYFGKKLAMGLRVPPSMLDAHMDTRDQPQFNDMKVGQVYQTEIRYMGYIRRIQKKLSKEIYKHFKSYCRKYDYAKYEEVDLQINAPQSFALYKQNEVNQQILNVYQTSDRVETFSKRYALKKYAQMDEDDIVENEYWMLKEMGVTDEQINQMEDYERYMLVYGTASSDVKEKYGIPQDDGGSRW